ncbi:MAG TPA: PAS domain-containing protein [Steroidobacteraceae bacterium]|nr:PAS domain-containing protein [Steroidobacteraceae bacterium]
MVAVSTMADNESLTERQLLERLSIATQAAGIFVWELEWATHAISFDVNRIGQTPSNRHFGQELGSELFKWVHPDDMHIGHRVIEEALARGEDDAAFRYRLQLADGSIRHIQAYARTTTDADGKPLRSLGVSWDITEEVEAAEQLRRNAEQERKLLAHLSIAAHAAGIECWEYDYQTERFTWFYGVDPAFGLEGIVDPAELGRRLIATVLPEDSARVRAETARALAARETSLVTRMRRRMPDGQVRQLQLYQRFTFDERGQPLRSQGATRDVTVEVEAADRFRAQAEALHDAQRRLERASLSIHEGHWEMDLESRKHWASSSYCLLLGYDPAELAIDTMDQVDRLIHPDDLAPSQEISVRHIESATPYQHEIRLRHKDGSYRWFLVRGLAEKDAGGRPIRLSGSVQDIHKQKLAESALADARQRFERAIRGTQDGLWEWDLVRRSLWVSPRFEAILGYREGAISAAVTSPDELVHPEDREACESAQQAHFEQNQPCDLEVRMRAASGEYRWVRMRGQSERDAFGRPLRLAGSMQDVTEARAARDALIQASEAAQAANRSKSAFLANVSHEIRTPMNGILGMTSLLLDTTLDGSQREFAETIHASASSLLAVINDILDFSKIEAGKLDIDVSAMSPAESVEEVRAILAFQAAAKSLKLEATVDASLPRRVLGDRQRIRQCLINLVSNAIKFTHTGAVSVRVFPISSENGMVLTRFEVRDTGIGIAPETLSTLFQPFTQADSSTTRHFGGTGLGLSIVRRLVELMGGEVGVESELGRGSNFWLELPLPVLEDEATRDASAAAGAERVPSARRDDAGIPIAGALAGHYSGKVLLVEDNAINQKVARSFLERLGCRVTLAANGLEAVHAFAQARFDLVLLDLQMPLMDGYAATNCLRKLEQGRRRTPIVALTASAMTGQLDRCLEAGMDDLLTKPLDVKRLQAILDRLGMRAERGSADEAGEANGEQAPVEITLDEAAVVQIVAASPLEPPLDAAAFDELTGGDAEFERELAHTFVHTSEELLAELSRAAGHSDRSALSRAAHSLKGASANIHARPLRALCAELETGAATFTDVELMRHIARLGAERQRVITALHVGASERRKAAGNG